jgi:hypothetical protein
MNCLWLPHRSVSLQAARAKLLSAAARARSSDNKISPLVTSSLAVLHSYSLVKPHVAADDHMGAARLLKRVCAHISRFELHAARIMTSAVMECMRAGLPESAFEIAVALLQPEYKDGLAAMGGTYKRKIQGVVRHLPRLAFKHMWVCAGEVSCCLHCYLCYCAHCVMVLAVLCSTVAHQTVCLGGQAV